MLLKKLVSSLLILLGFEVLFQLTEKSSNAIASENVNTPKREIINALAIEKVVNRRVVLKLNERRVYLYKSDRLLASYPVAVGKQGWETPTGTYQVMKMVKNPTWEHPWNGKLVPPGPENPLGDRWIGFWTDGKNAIGFHGTPDENLIGQAVSHGCVRMRNRDIQAFFEKVNVGTLVVVER
jgi:lipoprotein-anchoring transpeptidase ErfK/SrfK